MSTEFGKETKRILDESEARDTEDLQKFVDEQMKKKAERELPRS